MLKCGLTWKCRSSLLGHWLERMNLEWADTNCVVSQGQSRLLLYSCSQWRSAFSTCPSPTAPAPTAAPTAPAPAPCPLLSYIPCSSAAVSCLHYTFLFMLKMFCRPTIIFLPLCFNIVLTSLLSPFILWMALTLYTNFHPCLYFVFI